MSRNVGNMTHDPKTTLMDREGTSNELLDDVMGELERLSDLSELSKEVLEALKDDKTMQDPGLLRDDSLEITFKAPKA